MKPVSVRYERVFNLGNYESERVGIELALEDGDDPNEAREKARAFCNGSLFPPDKVQAALAVLARDYSTPQERQEAERILASVPANGGDPGDEADKVGF